MVVRGAMVLICQLIVLWVLHSNDLMDTWLLGAIWDKLLRIYENPSMLVFPAHLWNLCLRELCMPSSSHWCLHALILLEFLVSQPSHALYCYPRETYPILPSIRGLPRLNPVYLRRYNAFSSEEIVIIVNAWNLVELRVSASLHALNEWIGVFINTMLWGSIVTNTTAALVVQLVYSLLHLSNTLRYLRFVLKILH